MFYSSVASPTQAGVALKLLSVQLSVGCAVLQCLGGDGCSDEDDGAYVNPSCPKIIPKVLEDPTYTSLF